MSIHPPSDDAGVVNAYRRRRVTTAMMAECELSGSACMDVGELAAIRVCAGSGLVMLMLAPCSTGAILSLRQMTSALVVSSRRARRYRRLQIALCTCMQPRTLMQSCPIEPHPGPGPALSPPRPIQCKTTSKVAPPSPPRGPDRKIDPGGEACSAVWSSARTASDTRCSNQVLNAPSIAGPLGLYGSMLLWILLYSYGTCYLSSEQDLLAEVDRGSPKPRYTPACPPDASLDGP
ncbi:hypothetical protein C2E23DRAFT_401771 [Lenzites betulinus]|nr:hypothetical protein C2E23DRAFT_401771 [Lenzites betulinus]